MATVREVILPRDKKLDGTWNVKIRVTHQRKVSYISTQHFVTEKHIRKDYTIKDPIILKRLNQTLDDFRTKITELGPKLEVYSLAQLMKYLQNKGIKSAEEIDVIEFGRNRILELRKNNRNGSAGNMTTVINGLTDYFGSEIVPITEIKSKMLVNYEKFLLSKRKITRPDQFNNLYHREVNGLSNNGLHNHMRDLRILFNEIKNFYNDEDEDIIVVRHYPFKKYKITNKVEINKPKLTPKQVKAIWDCAAPTNSRMELARDLFMLSFFLCGMNAVDLYQLPAVEDLIERVNYNRSKTRSRRKDRAFISISIPEIATPLYLKYAGKLQERYATHNGLDRALSFGIREIGKLTKISDLEFYDARHAVGDWARNICRYTKDDVALVLNHKDQSKTVTDIYISKNWVIVDEVQEAVIKVLIMLSQDKGIKINMPVKKYDQNKLVKRRMKKEVKKPT